MTHIHLAQPPIAAPTHLLTEGDSDEDPDQRSLPNQISYVSGQPASRP